MFPLSVKEISSEIKSLIHSIYDSEKYKSSLVFDKNLIICPFSYHVAVPLCGLNYDLCEVDCMTYVFSNSVFKDLEPDETLAYFAKMNDYMYEKQRQELRVHPAILLNDYTNIRYYFKKNKEDSLIRFLVCMYEIALTDTLVSLYMTSDFNQSIFDSCNKSIRSLGLVRKFNSAWSKLSEFPQSYRLTIPLLDEVRTLFTLVSDNMITKESKIIEKLDLFLDRVPQELDQYKNTYKEILKIWRIQNEQG